MNMNKGNSLNQSDKTKYVKPAIVHREKIEVLAIVCDSSWNKKVPCRIINQPSCLKTRI